jgi:hypothetical protein
VGEEEEEEEKEDLCIFNDTLEGGCELDAAATVLSFTLLCITWFEILSSTCVCVCVCMYP